jgi:hypothetical protein
MIAAVAEVDSIVIYRSVDREGATFALKPSSRDRVRARFGDAVRLRSRVFIAHEAHADDTETLGDLGPQVVRLLTGLSKERLEEDLDRVVFRDPETGVDIHESAVPASAD